MTQALFIASVLPVILIGMYIYKKDKNKEPTKLLTSLFVGGICSCFITIIISTILLQIFISKKIKNISVYSLIKD